MRIDRRFYQPADRVLPLRGWLTTRQLACRLSFSTRTLERWRAAGTGPPWHRVGRHIRYDLAEVDQWIDDHTVYPLPPPGWPRRRLLHLVTPLAEGTGGPGESEGET